MKSLFSSLLLLVVMRAIAFSQALSGTYTIGSVSADYSTLNSAVQDLIANGIDSSVIFNVQTGTYNEQILIPPIQGASATNTITFQSVSGDSTNVVLQFDADTTINNYVIGIDTASYITIKNISIIALDTLYGCAVSIANGAQYITLEGDVIQGNGSVYPTIYSTYNDYLTIANNLIINGQSGIYLTGKDVDNETGNYVYGNTIINSVNVGIYAKYQWRHSILDNLIIHPLSQEDTWAGISLMDCQGNSNNQSLVANNMISCNVTMLSAGILLSASDQQLIYHNSILMYGNATDSRSFDQESGGGSNEVKNNIFSNEAGGLAYYMEDLSSFSADNNVFYCPSGTFGYYTAYISTFDDWKSVTNKDASSIQCNPEFISQTDLHIQQKILTAKGGSQTLVPTDFDGEMRDTIRPTPGADRLTAGCSNPLAGSYSIGPTGDFTTFSDAVLALESCGISAPVSFYVEAGTYNEQINLSYIRYATDNDSIRFISQIADSTSVILQYDPDSLQNYVVKLSGVKNVLFRDMTFQVSDTAGRVIVLQDSVDNIDFTYDRIIGPKSVLDDNSNSCVFFGKKDNADTTSIEFNNTSFANGSYGIDIDFGSGGTVKTNLEIQQNQFSDQSYAAIWLQGVKNTQIVRHNTIQSSNNPAKGIYIAFSDSTNIAYNKIVLSSDRSCVGIDNYSSHNIIFNNFISLEAKNLATIVGYSSTWPSDLYYNSILCYGDENYFSYCVELSTYSEFCELKNNNCVNLNGEVIRISPIASSNYDFDHNNFYTPTEFLARNGDTEINNIQEWKTSTALDSNSVSVNSVFVSNDDLHTHTALLNGTGIPVAECTDDIDGEPRDVAHPDIGADEFNNPVFTAGNDTVFCFNSGSYPTYAGSHVYDIGYGYDSYAWSNGSDSSSIVIDSVDVHLGVNLYSVTVTLGSDSYTDSVNIFYDLPVALDQNAYCYWNSPITITANSGYMYNWSTGDTTQSITVKNGGYTVTVTDLYGCQSREDVGVKLAQGAAATILPGDTSICLNGSISLKANNYTGNDVYNLYHYEWNNGDTTQSIDIDPSVMPLGETPFSVTVYLAGDSLCSSTDTSIVTVQNCLGIKQRNNEELSIYPNPAQGDVIIKSGTEIKSIEIYSIEGVLIKSKDVNDKYCICDISSLLKGTYIMKIYYVSGSRSVKFDVK